MKNYVHVLLLPLNALYLLDSFSRVWYRPHTLDGLSSECSLATSKNTRE